MEVGKLRQDQQKCIWSSLRAAVCAHVEESHRQEVSTFYSQERSHYAARRAGRELPLQPSVSRAMDSFEITSWYCLQAGAHVVLCLSVD